MAKILIGASREELAEEIDGFFMRRDPVWQTLERVTKRLREADIPHAVIGGMSLTLHGYVRPTADVDILTTHEGLDDIHRKLVGLGYVPAYQGARKTLKDTTTGVKVDFIMEGEYPGDSKAKAVQFPDPRSASVDRIGFNVISVPKLIELKLASGMTNPLRLRDLADVQDLIVALKLSRDLARQLDPSVRDEYLRMWEAAENADQPS